MELIPDGHALLHGVIRKNIGNDTVFLYDSATNTIYICAHLKEWKTPESRKGKADEFSKQLTAILTIASKNPDKECILMVDANTQFSIEGNRIVGYSKDLKVPYVAGSTPSVPFTYDAGPILSVIARFPTSFKMRGAHTAQLDKSFKPVTAVIDHIIIFNARSEIRETRVSVLNKDGELQEVEDLNTPTTSPLSIADHALVVCDRYGTLNIKGGNTEDAAWAEFVPKEYFAFFKDAGTQETLNGILESTFRGFDPEKIKKELSSPRCSIFDINLPNALTPVVNVIGTSLHIVAPDTDASLVLDPSDSMYRPEGRANSELSEWIDILLKDLNNLDPATKSKEEATVSRDTKRKFLLEKGYLLLNYWHTVQTTHGLSEIYEAWNRKSSRKVPISEMVKQAKEKNPNLKVLALQELPKMLEDCTALVREIEGAVSCKVYFYDDAAIDPTRGGIVVFEEARKLGGGSRLKKSRKVKKSKKSTKKRRSS